MSKKKKLVERFKAKPTDFSWIELENMLSYFGYKLLQSGKTGGSRVKFIHDVHPIIFIHKPHPGRILKKYQIEYIFDFLNNEGLL